MAIYAGETLIVTNTMTLEGKPVVNDEVDSVAIEIYNSDGEVIVDTLMSWNAEEERFEYRWDTGGSGATPVAVDPGSYRTKITVHGLNGETNWEFSRLRLGRNPV